MSALRLRFSTRLVMGSSRNHTKMRCQSRLARERFLSSNKLCLMSFIKDTRFIPDLIAFDTVVLDTKVIDRITDHERGLMLNYLRIAKLRVGVILNFKRAKLEWDRIVL